MIKVLHTLLLFMLSLMLLWANSSFAHQQKAAETTLLMNKDLTRLEVSHRFYIHDTEHAVQHLFDKHADILDSTTTQQKFADYVADQFSAKTLNDTALNLENVGYEVEGKFFWVYQEARLPAKVRGLKVFNGTLRELWPTQVNMVNIEGNGGVRTLYFNEGKTWLTVKF